MKKTFTSLKTVTHDTAILDAQKISINTDVTSPTQRTNLLEYIDKNDNKLDEKIDSLSVFEGAEKTILAELADKTFERYSEYDNSVYVIGTESTDNSYTSSVRFGYTHMPHGVINKVSFYGRNSTTQSYDSKENGCYLIAQTYKTDGTLVRSMTSLNKVVVLEYIGSGDRPLNTWEFEGLISPKEDEIIKFIPSDDGFEQKSGYYFGVWVDITHTHNDCQCGGDGDFVNNPLQQGAKYLALCRFEGEFYSERLKDYGLNYNEKDFISRISTSTKVELWNNNINNESLGGAEVKAFVLSRPYIRNGIYNDLRWESTGNLNSTVYMHLTIKDKTGRTIKTMVSNNNENFAAQGLKSFRFTQPFEITDEVGSIVCQTSTDGINPSTSAKWRTRVIGNAAKDNANGSEATGNNFVCNVIFWGPQLSLAGDFLSKTEASNTYVTKTTANGYASKTELESYATKQEVSENYVTNDVAANFVTKEELESYQDKQQYYDAWTNLNNNDIVDKAGCYSFQLDKTDFVSGRIDRIEIPYIKGSNAEGYLCVQFFDSSNNVISSYTSNNKQKQDKTGEYDRGLCEFEFNTFETPEDYAFVRMQMIQYSWTVPTGNSGMQMRMCPIKRNSTFTWNTNTNTCINNTGTRWTVLVNVLTRNYAKNTGITIRNYDWTPDVFCPINVSLSTAGSTFVAPTNGWIISKSAQTTSGANSLTLNGIEIAKSSGTAQVDLQILMRKGEFVTATTSYSLVFYPCKSEQFDYRLEGGNTMYDIWKGAVVYDEYGQPTVKDLYVPDASAWKSEVGNAVIGKIATISEEAAYDASGNKLFNIQSGAIENGKGLLVGSTITSWNASLENLRVGEQMFGYSNINTWNTALPLMWKGDNMFYGCPQLTSFNTSLPSLTSGWHMFTNCSSLTDVTIGSLASLTDGTNMFKGCSLSYASLLNVLNALPQRTATIDITVGDSAANDMSGDDRFSGVEIPASHSDRYFTFTHNGWTVRLTSQSGFIIGSTPTTPYDVSRANGYIPDARAWRDDMGDDVVLNITRVSNFMAYND